MILFEIESESVELALSSYQQFILAFTPSYHLSSIIGVHRLNQRMESKNPSSSTTKGKQSSNTTRRTGSSSNPTDNPNHPQSSSSSSRLTKLDGVLFHFYSKTSAVITQSRLSHYSHSQSATVTESHSRQNSSTSNQDQVNSNSPNTRKASKWVGIRYQTHL